MRAVISQWWTYGQTTRWTTRDYARHFAYVSAWAFVGLCFMITFTR